LEEAVPPGDTVIVKAGTYKEQVGVFAPHAGTPGHPITFQAHPGDGITFVKIADGITIKNNHIHDNDADIADAGFPRRGTCRSCSRAMITPWYKAGRTSM
jgi:hypothetical protein